MIFTFPSVPVVEENITTLVLKLLVVTDLYPVSCDQNLITAAIRLRGIGWHGY